MVKAEHKRLDPPLRAASGRRPGVFGASARSLRWSGVARKILAATASLVLVGSAAVHMSGPAEASTDPAVDIALSLPGTTNYAQTASSERVIPGSGSFTLQTWFKDSNTGGNWPTIVSQGASGTTSFRIERNGNGTMHWQYGGFGSNFGWYVPANQWTHLSFVYSETTSGNSVRIYLNGNLSYSWNAGSRQLQSVGTGFVIGGFSADPTNANRRFQGQVDETRVYSRALSQNQVQEAMHTYGPVNASGLVAYYDFNGQSLASRATGEGAASNATLTMSQGVPSWEDIATTYTTSTTPPQQYVAFTRSYLTSEGGWQVPAGAASIDYLVVGGGGGGGARHAGGGGGGGVLDGRGAPVAEGEAIKITVGPGGQGGNSNGDGRNGQSSTISVGALVTTALGGGGGGGAGRSGLVGASGGGGGSSWGPGAQGTTGQGFAGGGGRFYRFDNGGENWHGGGGGGATKEGTRPIGIGDWMSSGHGGDGRAVSWFTTTQAGTLPIGRASGTSVYFAGGGAGGKWGHGRAGTPGLGGGGGAFGGAAAINSGSGGGGGAGGIGGYGGSGVILISYSTVPNPVQSLQAKALTESEVIISWDEPQVNGATVHEYLITWSKDNWVTSGSATVLRSPGGGSQSYSLAGLDEATSYDFRVTAKNPQNSSTVATASAKTWVKVGSSPASDCVAYVSASSGVKVFPDGPSHCRVEFTSTGSLDWAVPPGAATLDALVVGGGGAGGASAGSGGSGGAVVDVELGLGTSRISQLAIDVGAGGVGGASPTAGAQSKIQGTDGSNSLTVTSPGGPSGKASNDTRATPGTPSATKVGSSLTITERVKQTSISGGAGLAWTPFATSSATGQAGGGGWAPTWLTGRSFGGGGGGGPVALTDAVLQTAVYIPGTAPEDLEPGVPDRIELTYSLDLSGSPLPADFSVGVSSDSAPSVQTVAVSGKKVTLTLNTWLTSATTVSYTAPASGGLKTATTDVILSSFSNVTLSPNSGTLAKTFVATTAGSASSGGGASASSTVTAGLFGVTEAKPGTANTGGGGGAGLYSGDAVGDVGADGGSGIVVLRYRLVNPPIVVSSPADLTVVAGESATFTAVFSAPASHIRWQKSTTAGATWTNISGATTENASTSTFTVSETKLSDSGTSYRAVGKNTVGLAFAETPTLPASLTVLPDPNTLPAGAFCDGRSTQNGLTTTAQHGRVFYIDSGDGQNIDAAYVGYSVQSTTERQDLWVEIADFTGGVVTLADPAASEMPLGEITADGSGTAFFLLKATEPTLTAQSHVVRVYSQKPSSADTVPLYECGFVFSQVMETLPEPTNKVQSVTSTTVSAVGSTMTITVTGDTGEIGTGDVYEGRMFGIVPAARSSWPTGAIRLEKTELSMFEDEARTLKLGSDHVNVLRLNDSNGLDSAERQYWTAVYTFRVLGPASQTAPIVPIAMISSGTQVMHTDLATAGSFPSPSSTLDLTPGKPASTVKVTKNVTSSVGEDGETEKHEVQVRDDGTTWVPYEVTLENSGTTDIVVDEILDTPDSQVAFVTGSALYDGKVVADPALTGDGSELAFSGPLTVPAGETTVLTYFMAIETCKVGDSYSLENSAVARVGEVTIGSGPSTQSLVILNANCGETEVSVFVDDVSLHPEVITGTASAVTDVAATLSGLVDPNGQSGDTVRFSYGTDQTLQSSTPVALDPTTNSTEPYAVSKELTGLQASTTYYYRLEVRSGDTWIAGETLSFVTTGPAGTPVATTTAVSEMNPAGGRATFTGTIDANGVAGGVTATFEYGRQIGGVCPVSGTETSSVGDTVTGSTPVARSLEVSGLVTDAPYCVRIVGKAGELSATGNWVTFVLATKQSQKIWWSTGTKPLPAGGTTTVSAFAESGVAVTYTSVDENVCSVNSTSGLVTAKVESGSCSITAREDVGNATFGPAQPETITLTISAPVIVTTVVDSGRYMSSYSTRLIATGGDGTFGSWAWTGDLPPGLTLNASTGVIFGTPTVSGIYVVSVSTVSKGVRSKPQTLTITVTKVPITVTAASFELTFGDAPPVVTPTYDESQFVAPDTPAVVTATNNTPPRCSTTYTFGTDAGDEYASTRCGGGWATNYSYSYISGSITVAPLPVTITALDGAKKITTADPASFAYVVSPPLPAGQTMDDVVVGGEPTLTRVAGEDLGQYAITPTGTVAQKPYEARKADCPETDPPDPTACVETRYRTNYTLIFTPGTFTVTNKDVPQLTTTAQETIFGSTLSGALASTVTNSAEESVPGTTRYSYVNGSGTVVTVTDLSRLPAGSYTVTVTFTPSDTATYFGPVSAVLPLTVKPYQLTLTALDRAKQNVLSDDTLTVRPDPALTYQLHPPLPSGQTLTDVFPNGVSLSRLGSGTASGEYPRSNATLLAKEGLGTYAITASADASPNYQLVPVDGLFTITGKKVPQLSTTDHTLPPNTELGTRLNATATLGADAVPGVISYSYRSASGEEVTVTSATALPLGLYSVRVRFSPTDTGEYFGPIYAVMVVTVASPPPSGRGPRPGGPTPTDPQSPNGGGTGGFGTSQQTTGGDGTGGNTQDFTSGTGGTSTIGQTTSATRPIDGFGGGVVPMGPGFGSLLQMSGLSPSASSAGQSGARGGPTMAELLTSTTVDRGQGVEPLTEDMVQGMSTALGKGKRSLAQLGRETFQGFTGEGSPVRAEALGARTGAQFVVPKRGLVDAEGVARLISASADSWTTEFFRIDSVSASNGSPPIDKWSVDEQQAIAVFFTGAGLMPPISLASVDQGPDSNWVAIESRVSGYQPGSVVYLAVTSSPIVIGAAVVALDGTAVITGALPVDVLEAGEHRIRAVGTRVLEGVSVGPDGDVRVPESVLAELALFDGDSVSTVAFMGSNDRDGTHIAVRMVSFEPPAPWWTLVLLAGVGAIVLVLRRADLVFTSRRRALPPVTVAVAAVPALLLGALASAPAVAWWGAGLALILMVSSWLLAPSARKL